MKARTTLLCALFALFSAQSYSQNADYVEDANRNLGIKMIYVEGGTFTMGATSEHNNGVTSIGLPTHNVTIDSFYIAECEVTQAQWQKVTGLSAEQQRDKGNPKWEMQGVGDDYPIYFITWEEAQAFCRELSTITGKNYQLPTEAQWEYAARGGKQSKGYKYIGGDTADAVAWHVLNSEVVPHPVKQKGANELGLYDMAGNLWEWCSDWLAPYDSSSKTNPTGAEKGNYKVLRGGSFNSHTHNCTVSYRSGDTPTYRGSRFGFRVVCLP